jgi:hypothetical protein
VGYDRTIRQSASDQEPGSIVVEAYGARLAVSAPDREILDRLLEGLPVGWSACRDVEPQDVEWRFAVTRSDDGYRVRDGDGVETETGDLDLAVGLMRMQLRRFVGYHAKDLVFVHAGVVAHAGRAIVIPGHSFSGKSTLVAALVRAGADYYSDEYAVIGEDGLVRPYHEPLALRGAVGMNRETLTAEELGGEAGERPAPIGLVAVATYVPGATWAPREISPAQGVLALLEHAIPVQDRPEQTLGVLRRALGGTIVLAGERGEAAETAQILLETAMNASERP